MFQLNTKRKAIENERMSLVTVIKMLQSDQIDQNLHQHQSGDQGTQTSAKWNTKTSEFAKRTQKTGSFLTAKLPPRGNTIQQNNRFNALTVDEQSVHEVEPNVPSQGTTRPLT